ncbi:MAG: Mor transcription activator family protein [Candidatus Methylumidiphilus sp.]
MLPQQIRDIADVCGRDVAAALLEHFNGRRIRVADLSRLDDSNPVAQAIGLEAAERLSKQYGGEFLYIPRAFHALLKLRNDAICQRRLDNPLIGTVDFVNRVAAEEGLSDRQVYKIIGSVKMPCDPRQPSLF